MSKPEIFDSLDQSMVDKTDEVLQAIVRIGSALLESREDKKDVFAGFVCMAYVAGRVKERKEKMMKEMLD